MSRRRLGTVLGFGAALSLAPALAPVAAADPRGPGVPGAVPPGAPGGTGPRLALPPADLPASPPPPTTIEPVPFAPGAPRDAVGAREARSPAPFGLVAVTWAGPAPDRIEVRTVDDAGRWGEWVTLESTPDERDDLPTRALDAPGGSDPIWVGARTAVQVRATRAGAPVTDSVEVLRIDPGASPGDDAIGARARSGVAAPAFVTRAQWGADERMMSWRPTVRPAVRAVTLHHTAESNGYGPGDSARIVRGIYAYHARSQGWGDIGYNALVDKFGTIFEGRAGGMDKAVVAAHAGGFNQDTWGIGLMGEHTRTPIGAAQFESAARLAAWKLAPLYGDADQRVSLTSTGGGTSRFPRGQSTSVPALFGHRDVGATACPGNVAYDRLPALRARVREVIAEATRPVPPPPPPGAPPRPDPRARPAG